MSEVSPPITWVVAVALIAANGHVLMQKRRQDRSHGGLWEFPGGKIEPGETPEAAAAREICEELGVELDRSALQPVSFASHTAGPSGSDRQLVILLYACRRWQGQPRCLDAEELAWCTLEQLEHLDMPPLDYPLARAVIGALQRYI